MARETRPKDYPKLKNYQPSKFMLPTSHYDKEKADRAVKFIENLCHTKGKWAGKRFWLLPWQEQLIRDIFGIVKSDGNRQFRTAFVEICKKVGKSELAAAIALYLLYADNEPSAEVYGAAADRQQASIVFDVARQMVEMSPALLKRSKIMGATKRIVNYGNAGYYQVLSAEVGGKHGFSVSGLVFDEIHTQPNRQLYDVLTKGSSDARQNPLHFIITTAGTDRHSIAYELHTKAIDILEGRRVDPTFYPVVYGLKDDEDWEDEANWYKVNPSLGYTVDIERLRDAYREAKQNPADEITFRWLRMNQWVSSTTAWIPDQIYQRGNEEIDLKLLEGRECYGGLDLSSTGDITAFVLMFPPRDEEEKYIVLPFFWVPEETIPQRVKANSVPYDVWERQGYLMSTEGNVIHYDFIEKFIEELGEKYHILEIAFDRWGATQMVQDLEGMGFTVVPFGQGYSSMSAPTKEFYKILMEGNMVHDGHPVLRWMAGNVVIDTDPAGNIKVTKARSKEKIDGTRKLPMTEDVYRMFQAILEDRPTDLPEIMVDGYIGFLFRDKNGMPEIALHWEHRLKNAVNRYNSIFRVQMPKITPHICRHTYCSNQAKAGMNPKTLQYLMGHSDIGVTMNTYTHLCLDDAKNEMIRMEELEQARKEVDKAEGKKPMKQNMFKVV